jgi:RimJ/RimL family protein N-acetyltransferase
MITETHRLVIRELTVDDAAFVLRLTNEPSFLSNIADKGIRNLDDAKQFLREGSWTNQKRRGYGQFVVVLKEDQSAVGVCGLLYRENLDMTDVGFAFLPEYWGHGYAFEAAAALVEYGHNRLGIDSIVGLTTKGNKPSIRLLEKLGMRYRKTVRTSDDDPGTRVYE